MSWKLMENSITLKDRFDLVKFILFSDRFTMGDKVKEVEQEWAEWIGAKHALFVSSGSTANFLLLASVIEQYGLKRGDKVLVSSCTWMTNISPIIQLGLIPVFCDINFDNFSFNEIDLDFISQKYFDIKVIFVTHLLGFYSDTKLLKAYFPNAIIIEDACESMGAKTDDLKYVGSDSLGCTFSSYFGHTISSIEGGFITTNNTKLYDLMKMKRSHGLARESMYFDDYAKKYNHIDKQFLFITDGYNFRNHEICAMLASSQIKKLNSFIKIRNINHTQFSELTEKHSNKIYQIKRYVTSASFCFPIICKTHYLLPKLKELLLKYNIEYRPIISGNLLDHPFLDGYEITSNKKYNNVDVLSDRGLYIGNNQFVNKKRLEVLDHILTILE
jgi:CDP-6-deoxy-D-xylo-4-hexulose-3-dehydrase